MISNTKRFIMVHIPRTGGTQVEAWLGHYGITLKGEHNRHSMYFKHAFARDIRRMMGTLYEEYFKFSVVRNPWDWVVSNYMFNRGLHLCYVSGTRYEILRTPGQIPPWAKDMTFDHWLRWWLDEFQPTQVGMLLDDVGRPLMNEVYKFESLRDDIQRLCTRLGLQIVERPADTRSHGRDPDYRSYYSERSRQWVAEHFRREVEQYGYAFDDFAKRV